MNQHKVEKQDETFIFVKFAAFVVTNVNANFFLPFLVL